jgi:hypothetical protein
MTNLQVAEINEDYKLLHSFTLLREYLLFMDVLQWRAAYTI